MSARGCELRDECVVEDAVHGTNRVAIELAAIARRTDENRASDSTATPDRKRNVRARVRGG